MTEPWPCSAGDDAYSGVCSRLRRLCPRLVPSPLWGLSLARLARLAPQAALAVCDSCPGTVEALGRYWRGLSRGGACEVCGGPGGEVDEDWLYHVEGGGRGVACLARLRLLCSSCHLAKHQGYALVTGRSREAVEHLARVNRVSLEEARRLVGEAFQVHRRLSRIRDWVINVAQLPGMDEGLRAGAERLLNTMYRMGFSVMTPWLYYSGRVYSGLAARRAAAETLQVLREAAERAGGTGVGPSGWEEFMEALLQTLRESLEPLGVRVLGRELRVFLRYLLEGERPRRTLEQLLETAAGGDEEAAATLLDEAGLTGKWMVFTSPGVYPIVFRRAVEALEAAGLAYEAKMLARARDYAERRDLPVIVYVPSALAPRFVAETAATLWRVLEGFPGEGRRLMFKPDLFTLKGVYTGRAKHKPYIYVYRPE